MLLGRPLIKHAIFIVATQVWVIEHLYNLSYNSTNDSTDDSIDPRRN
jgi:hypothetical protein